MSPIFTPIQKYVTDFYVTGSVVNAGLWSAAECEVLVLSGNLPLLRPVFRRARIVLKWHSGQSQKVEDEESSGILELSGKGHYSIKKPPYSVVSRAAVAQGTTDGGTRAGFRDDLPRHEVLMDVDLERYTPNLRTMTPASSTEPSVIRESM